MQISRNTHLDRLYNIKSPDPIIDTRKPSVPNYQNDLILPSNGKIKQATSPVVVTPREKIDGTTKLSLEDVCKNISYSIETKGFCFLFYILIIVRFCITKSCESIRSSYNVRSLC